MRVSDTSGGAKDAEELVALTANASEKAEFLKNHSPGNNGKNREQQQNPTRDPAGLSKDVTEIGDEKRSEQENDATPQSVAKFSYFKNVTHAHRVVKTNQMRKTRSMLTFWNREAFGRIENFLGKLRLLRRVLWQIYRESRLAGFRHCGARCEELTSDQRLDQVANAGSKTEAMLLSFWGLAFVS